MTPRKHPINMATEIKGEKKAREPDEEPKEERKARDPMEFNREELKKDAEKEMVDSEEMKKRRKIK